MIKNYLRTAFRTLTRNASTSLLNLLGLSVGMTAAVLIFLWVDNEMTFDSYHKDAGRIYRLTTNMTREKWVWATTPLPLAQHLRTDLASAEAVACMQPSNQTNIHLGSDIVEEKNAAYVDTGWFSLFHYDFIAGGPSAFNRHPFSLILTQSKARKYFGDRDAIGQTLLIDSTPYQVAGVVRDLPANSSFQQDMLIPVEALLSDSAERKYDMKWGNYDFLTFVKLRPAASPVAAGNAISGIVKKNNPHAGDDVISLTALKDMHFETSLNIAANIPHIDRKTVYIFSILGIFLLLIACINYVNLTTARASLRAREVGIRKIVGAGKKSLFSQFLVESLTVSILSLALTLVLVTLAMPMFRQLTGTNMHNPLAAPDTWKIIGGTLLAATLLNGIYPALLLSSFQPLNVLKGQTLINFKDVSLRKGLVVLQFTFSIVLIASTIIIQRQLQYIQHTSPGYDRSQVFTFRIPWTMMHGKKDDEMSVLTGRIKQQLTAYPAISSVSFASQSIVALQSSNSGSANWDGKDPDYMPTVFQLSADESFKDIMQMQMAQGRWFDPQQTTDRHNFILNETAVDLFNMHKPVIGQRFIFQQDTGIVIGVVKDFHYASLHKQIGPLAIMDRPSWQGMVYVRTIPGKATEALGAAHAVFSQLAPDRPFDYNFLDDSFNNLYKADTRTSRLILLFSAIAVLISCLGLLGLAAFTAQQRVREIGIRKVLGATAANILTLLSRDFVKLVIISVAAATPIAWWTMHGWLQDFAYHIPLTPWVFAGAGVLALTIAIITVATQTIRAARANPVKNLRTD